jgi:antitoxin component YwqK of YwqJK toxin-antitoxin module
MLSFVHQFTFVLYFLIGKRHGNGEYLYNDGSKYIGNWDSDVIKGEGTSWYPNGNK